MKLSPRLNGTRALVALTAASAVALVLGLFGVLSALQGGPVLPSQGTLEEILQDQERSADPGPPAEPGGEQPPAEPSGPPPPAPVRMVIPRIYIDAPVVTLGLNAERYPEVPERPDQVAWYDFTPAPGRSSNAVFSGHVDWQTRARQPIPGVFYRLRELQIGDELTLTLDDGSELRYRVSGNVATKYDDPNVVSAMERTNKDVITLITCGGTWVLDRRQANGGNYSHRIIVRAERVPDSVSDGMPVPGGAAG